MKYLSPTLSILLLVLSANIGFSQNMSEKEFKKRVVGKTITGHNTHMKFDKNGTFNGTYTNKGNINQIRGGWSYTKAGGYCRSLTIILGNGKIVERGKACQEMKFKGNGKVEIANRVYTLK